MGDSNEIVPPHLNAEVYRKDLTGTNTLSYWDYICIHSDGSTLLGSSELRGRYWDGAACVFKTVEDVHSSDPEKKKQISLMSGTNDGCFMSSDKVLLCEDSGALSVWSRSANAWSQWEEVVSVNEHDDSVLAVDSLDRGSLYVTTAADGTVKVWDVADMICINNMRHIHSMMATGVSVNDSLHRFATCSMDGTVVLRDHNNMNPDLELASLSCGVNCISWFDENQLLIGDESGDIHVVDIRNNNLITKLINLPAPVHRIQVKKGSPNFGVCCDNRIVSVYKLESNQEAQLVYVHIDGDTDMNNYIRGLAWDSSEDNVLHSVGWGGRIISHMINL